MSAASRSPWPRSFGVEDRGAFYDETGALLDVVQNHMLQVLANLMMDPPTGEDHEATRDQKAALLKAVRPLDASSIVRGQYRGYRSVPGVKPNSGVETFVAVKLGVDSWRWEGVPIFIRAGKCLPVTAAEVLVEFKRRRPRSVFGEPGPIRRPHAFSAQPRHQSLAMGLQGEETRARRWSASRSNSC